MSKYLIVRRMYFLRIQSVAIFNIKNFFFRFKVMIFSEHFECHSHGQVQNEQGAEHEERTAIAVGAFTKEGHEHRTGDTGEAPSG